MTRKGKFAMLCNNCREVKWLSYSEWDARLFVADDWICNECTGRPYAFTVALWIKELADGAYVRLKK